MPSRPACEKLIEYVRDLVGEVTVASPCGDDGCAPALSDDSIQRALDETRERVRYQPLSRQYTRLPGGVIAYHDYEADGFYDDDTVIIDNAYTPFPADAFDEFDALNGRFSFVADQRNFLYLSGSRYDPYAAAASVLIKMAAQVKSDVDFRDTNSSLSASQAAKGMLALAKEYRKQARVHSIEFGRSDT